jgi:magnesium-protoporphyrin IX monomethyl ester (oxidative) cyclase
MCEGPEGLHILDTRPVAVSRRHTLQGRSRELLLECQSPRRFADPEPALLDLVAQKLVLALGDRYLSLPVAGDLPTLQATWKFPGGYPDRPPGLPAYRVPELLRVAHA